MNHFPNHASFQKRLFAKFIDLLIVVALGLAIPRGVGSVLGFFYSLVCDGLPIRSMRGQSIGKKIMGIRVIDSSANDAPAGLKTSVIRNAPVGIVTFLMIIPFWGWILSLLIGIPFAAVELSLIARANRRQRLGDVMAESEVILALKGTSE